MLDRIDHVVLTTKDVDLCISFYTKVLGLEFVTLQKTRMALVAKNFKINVHTIDEEISLKASLPTPGSLDLCFISKMGLKELENHLKSCNVKILDGPVQRTGALGPMSSFYFNDPDMNLIEVSVYP